MKSPFDLRLGQPGAKVHVAERLWVGHHGTVQYARHAGRQRRTHRQTPVAHVRVDEHPFDARDLVDLLVDPHVGEDTASQRHIRQTRRAHPMAHVSTRDILEVPLDAAGQVLPVPIGR